MSREQIGATRDVYETLNGMIRDEAKRQGYSAEDAELAVDKIITSIYEFPPSEAKNSLVRRVFNAKDTIQTDKAYRAANDTLDSMKGLDQRAKRDYRYQLDSGKYNDQRIAEILSSAEAQNDSILKANTPPTRTGFSALSAKEIISRFRWRSG